MQITGAGSDKGSGNDYRWYNVETGQELARLTYVDGFLSLLGGFRDVNGNPILVFTAVANAVCYLAVTDAVTGDAPGIVATGPDANIGISLISKATGRTLVINFQNGSTNSGLAIRNTGTSVNTGSGVLFQVKAGTNIGAVSAVMTDATGSSEVADVFFRVVVAGVLAERARITGSTGAFNAFKGVDVASAATIAITGNLFHVTGTTNITSISGTNVQPGTEITIIFDGILTLTDGSNLKLAGSFVTSADDTIKLTYDGTNWYEIARSVN